MSARPHIPVMLDEVLAALTPAADEVIVDGTFGLGGYSEAILAAAACRVCAIDRDPHAIAAGEAIEGRHPGRLLLILGRFGEMEALLAARNIDLVHGVVLDIGVSSPQLDQAERGFSFAKDGPLDMRMGAEGPSAADVVNLADEGDLADIIYQLGEERASRRIAKAIVAARAQKPIRRTSELVAIVESAVGRGKPGGIHPATRTFQALRIYVNDELGELERGLEAAEHLLREGGRLVVVSFHSLEDRIVKQFFAERTGRGAAQGRLLPGEPVPPAPTFAPITKGALAPTPAEVARNPRARSAKLRAGRRTSTPPRPYVRRISSLPSLSQLEAAS